MDGWIDVDNAGIYFIFNGRFGDRGIHSNFSFMENVLKIDDKNDRDSSGDTRETFWRLEVTRIFNEYQSMTLHLRLDKTSPVGDVKKKAESLFAKMLSVHEENI